MMRRTLFIGVALAGTVIAAMPVLAQQPTQASTNELARLEWWKIGIGSVTVLVSVFASVLIARATLQGQFRTQEARASVDFRLKAAELALAAPNPTAALNRVRLLKVIFPAELGSVKLDDLDPAAYGGPRVFDFTADLLRILSQGADRRQIIRMWRVLGREPQWQPAWDATLDAIEKTI